MDEDRKATIEKEWGKDFKYQSAYGKNCTGQEYGSKFNIIENLKAIYQHSEEITTIVLYDDLAFRHIWRGDADDMGGNDGVNSNLDITKLKPNREYYFGYVNLGKIDYWIFDHKNGEFVPDPLKGESVSSVTSVAKSFLVQSSYKNLVRG